MNKEKIERFCEKIGLGIALSIIIIFIIFFNINNIAFGEIILYDVLAKYKINEDIKSFFKENEETLIVSNIENSEIGNVEIVGIDDISYEHEKGTEDMSISFNIPNKCIDINKLKNKEYLMKNFYNIDSSTSMSSDYFNIDKFLNTKLTIEKNEKDPKVLIFHTHANEMFKDSNPNDINEGVVGAGTRLSNNLEEKYGIKVMHVTDVFDAIGGKVQRNGAYERMEPKIKKILEENPSIELVIDLHRDGVNENTHLVENINGKPTAKIMFFNGISRIVENGKLHNISNLHNPYVDINLALSFNMQKRAIEKYQGFTRKIYIKPYRYSLHLKPKTLLIEAGAQTNTKEEIYNAMDILSDLINDVVFS